MKSISYAYYVQILFTFNFKKNGFAGTVVQFEIMILHIALIQHFLIPVCFSLHLHFAEIEFNLFAKKHKNHKPSR